MLVFIKNTIKEVEDALLFPTYSSYEEMIEKLTVSLGKLGKDCMQKAPFNIITCDHNTINCVLGSIYCLMGVAQYFDFCLSSAIDNATEIQHNIGTTGTHLPHAVALSLSALGDINDVRLLNKETYIVDLFFALFRLLLGCDKEDETFITLVRTTLNLD